MSAIKLLIVFGTRPEAIKLAPLVMELDKHPDMFKTVVCVTAQHRKMVDQFLETFDIKPHYDLNIMKNNQTLFDITSNALTETGKVIQIEKPDMIIVQGDTTTTLAASLAAYYHKVRIGHVEAGLRTQNKYSPFPEEINRRITSVMADVHFAPTAWSRNNLLAEGISSDRIIVTGNTVIDALLWMRKKIVSDNRQYKELKGIDFRKKIILVTGHRRENFGEGFENILGALRQIASDNGDIEIVYPVHLNPNVKKPAYEALSGIDNIKLLEPLDYEPFVSLMDHSYFIISDSGGVQEEAPSLGKPVLVTRNTTERPEAVESGAVRLVGTDKDNICSLAKKLLTDDKEYKKMSSIRNPYGDGRACERIIQGITHFFAAQQKENNCSGYLPDTND